MIAETAVCRSNRLGALTHFFRVGREHTLCGQRCDHYRVRPSSTGVTCSICDTRQSEALHRSWLEEAA